MSSYNKHLFKSVVSLCFSLGIKQNCCSVDISPHRNQVLPREAKVSRASPGSCSEFIHADTCPHSHLLTLPSNLIIPHTLSAPPVHSPCSPPSEGAQESDLWEPGDHVQVSVNVYMHALLSMCVAMCARMGFCRRGSPLLL